jgi:hypothetical protein
MHLRSSLITAALVTTSAFAFGTVLTSRLACSTFATRKVGPAVASAFSFDSTVK